MNTELNQISKPDLSVHRIFEILGLLSFVLLSISLGYQLIHLFSLKITEHSWLFWVLPLVILISWIGADFISGLVHFLGDSIGSEKTPILGPGFIFPFRDHHVDPKGITRHDFVETNGNNCLVSLPILIYYVFFWKSSGIVSSLIALFWFFLLWGIFATNQIHKWAHQDSPAGIVKILQKYKMILGPEHHKIHHTVPYDTYFCITTGWLNPILRYIHFYEILRWILRIPPAETVRMEESTSGQ
ncbi:fatty acid desaturase CarF family protein [Leptospira stimsonii]|uniref:Kua-ubiquitin conjugating enzyme hybrid localization domain protein n=1 Tax=Leptospira stimsonii TaxID=2202203 RepID=A0A396ZGY6_9LEPT|nr:fatty acid desaturase CarF family protein [Leptospira stimsonii]RHX92946.1 kua-ubiquitin conjugating enzyme hybrid localization domain protein [Leptospira stimsonii]